MNHYSQCLAELRPLLWLDTYTRERHHLDDLEIWSKVLENLTQDKYTEALLQFIVKLRDDQTESYVRPGVGVLKIGKWTVFPTIDFGSFTSFDIAPVNVQTAPVTVQTRHVELDEKLDKLHLEQDTDTLTEITTGSNKRNAFLDIHTQLGYLKVFVLALILVAETLPESRLRSLVKIHPNGMAQVKFLIFGCWREVPLTINEENHTSHMNSSADADLASVTLLERAYTCFRSWDCYNCAMDMATETYMLTGWFPETKNINCLSLADVCELFRLKKLGHNTLGIGCKDMSSETAEKLGVFENIQYVITDFDEKSKMITLTNPAVPPNDKHRFITLHLNSIRNFTSLYINWRPTQKFVARAPVKRPHNQHTSEYVENNAQYSFQNPTDRYQRVRILVEWAEYLKHWKSELQTRAWGSCTDTDFRVSVSVYQTDKLKVFTERQFPRIVGEVSQMPVFSFCVNMKPGKAYTAVVKFYGEDCPTLRLSLYHNVTNFRFGKPREKYPYLVSEQGIWNGKLSGHWGTTLFLINPEFDLFLPQTSDVVILFSTTEKPDINVHVVRIKEDQVGKHLRWFNPEEALFEEMYTRDVFMKEVKNMPAGNYRLVASAYDRHPNGKYELKVLVPFSMNRHSLTKLNRGLEYGVDLQTSMCGKKKFTFYVRSWYVSTRIVIHIANDIYRVVSGNDVSETIHLRARVHGNDDEVVWENDWTYSIYELIFEFAIGERETEYRVEVEQYEPGLNILIAYARGNNLFALYQKKEGDERE